MTSIFVVLVFGCTTPTLIGQPIINLSERMELEGVSVLPPQEKNWLFGGSPFLKDIVVFKKKLPNSSGIQELHSYLAVVTRVELDRGLTNPQDLLTYVNSKLKVMETRFQIIAYSVVLDEARSNAMDTDCVRYDIVSKEFDNPNFPGFEFVLASHGFECCHPSSPSVVIEAYCTERHPKDGQSAEETLRNECLSFLNNVQLKRLRAKTSPLYLDVPAWDATKWQQMIISAQQASDQSDKTRAEHSCHQAIYYADANTINHFYEYADLLKAQKDENSMAVRAKADKLMQLRTQQAESKEAGSMYLGFVPADILNEYADLLEKLLRTAEAESMRALSRAYQYTQGVHASRYRLILLGEDPRGLCDSTVKWINSN